MKLFLSGTSFLPRYGGPAVSVSRLAQALADAGVTVGLWAPDGSSLSSPITQALRGVHCLGGAAREALDGFGLSDIVHDNGIWCSHNHQLAGLSARRNIPRLVSLRGMTEPWALSYRKWKKKLAWTLYQRFDLKRAHYHHATALGEADRLRALGLGVPICVVPNGMDVPAQTAHRGPKRGAQDERTALFLSRIHPIKGLLLLLEAWAAVRPTGWVLEIAGPDENGHLAEVKALSEKLQISDKVRFLGPIERKSISSVYAAADLFILPTHSENFGMVVAEALAHSVPVLTTKGAPWPTLRDYDCGWWVDVSVEGLIAGLQQATATPPGDMQAMGKRGRSLIEKQYSWDTVSTQLISVYEEMLT